MAVREFKLKGKEELIAKLKAVRGDVEQGAKDVLASTTRSIVREIKNEIPTAVNGEPSKPGEAPHSQGTRNTGKDARRRWDLRGTAIRMALAKAELGKQIMAWVFVRFPKGNAFYGHMLEYGTRKMAARPFFWPIVNKFKGDADKQIRKVVSKAEENWEK